ncbi:transmembrane protein 180-like [Lampetra fluviatilis]
MKGFCQLNGNALAYSMTTAGASIINSIFSFYYVKLFLSQYHISEVDFHRAQVVYMVWNAVNDPLFGYLQDTGSWACCRSRRLAIAYGATLYAVAFLLPWFPWRSGGYGPGDPLAGVHLLVALCAFDGALTFVLLAQCALFAEISGRHSDRLTLLKYSQVASFLGSGSVLLCGLITNNMTVFSTMQWYCVLAACIAWLCMRYTGIHVVSATDKLSSHATASNPEPQDTPLLKDGKALPQASAVSLSLQIMRQRDFLLFVAMNFLQVLHVTFSSSFTLIFAEQLLPAATMPTRAQSVLYGAGFMCPQILVLCSQGLLQRVGYYRLLLLAFVLQLCLATITFVAGSSCYVSLTAFLLLDMVLPQAVFSLFNLPLSDIIDADARTHRRSSPLSSMVFGLNALFTKPAQSLAPMLVVRILNQHGYQTLGDMAGTTDTSSQAGLHQAMFSLLCIVPATISLLQLCIWAPFSIRSSHNAIPRHADL